jgi:hypothetical protein
MVISCIIISVTGFPDFFPSASILIRTRRFGNRTRFIPEVKNVGYNTPQLSVRKR